jgi:hypothetical protein
MFAFAKRKQNVVVRIKFKVHPDEEEEYKKAVDKTKELLLRWFPQNLSVETEQQEYSAVFSRKPMFDVFVVQSGGDGKGKGKGKGDGEVMVLTNGWVQEGFLQTAASPKQAFVKQSVENAISGKPIDVSEYKKELKVGKERCEQHAMDEANRLSEVMKAENIIKDEEKKKQKDAVRQRMSLVAKEEAAKTEPGVPSEDVAQAQPAPKAKVKAKAKPKVKAPATNAKPKAAAPAEPIDVDAEAKTENVAATSAEPKADVNAAADTTDVVAEAKLAGASAQTEMVAASAASETDAETTDVVAEAAASEPASNILDRGHGAEDKAPQREGCELKAGHVASVESRKQAEVANNAANGMMSFAAANAANADHEAPGKQIALQSDGLLPGLFLLFGWAQCCSKAQGVPDCPCEDFPIKVIDSEFVMA